ncbi:MULTISPECIES: NmrA family NAD(P)-binding protein [Burkholderiaceae]|uniref:Putative nucleoside-diphosphate-sugar epimerase n=1 Tax=Caballeronia sordidicola TaxID=196367 RepID=A0A242MU25_CABSO|nr:MULTISPECIES: NAD(P)H-binding protein [Burkholderiaceae]AME25437.1 NmrA family transcriptional regulator [Burkholderia sp. PAMC 26561]OTP74768.1 putative nucleoside-diphosphate-sugar epimerase [Caballeronia sordidicola]
MFAITGITGQVGGVVARLLLASGHDVRAVVRDAAKGEAWAKEGCEVAVADVNDQHALQHAFEGTEGVFVLLPPTFDPTQGFPEARKAIASLRAALAAARPKKVVVLSTIGAQATQPNLLNQLQIMEQELGTLPMPIAFLRAAWFIENAAWDIAPARETGIVPSFLQPLDKLVPMVATADIGRVAADLLRETWTGRRVIELEGTQRVSPDMIAASLGRLLGRDVRMNIVPRDTWEDLFRSQGMTNPLPRMQMIDGFNEEWICFEGGQNEVRRGRVPLDTVLQSLIEKGA